MLAAHLSTRRRTTGVRPLLVRTGFTRTALHARAGVDNSEVPRWLWLTPERVAEESLRALTTDAWRVTPGLRYRLLVAVTSPLPRHRRAQVLRRMAPLR